MTRTPASYYIRIDTFWQGSPDRFVGPFASRNEAETAIAIARESDIANLVLGNSHARDIKTAIRVHGILPASQAIRVGMKTPEIAFDGIGNTLPELPANADELFHLEQELHSW